MTAFVAYQVRGENLFANRGGAKCLSRFKQVKGVFKMPKLSKKAKQEWDFFINPNTGRRTYNKLCKKCHSDCKQSYRVIIVYCRKFKAKRSGITKDDK